MIKFRDFTLGEETATTTADVVGTGDDPADWMDPKKKKRKYSVLTRRYIEVAGKKKRLMSIK